MSDWTVQECIQRLSLLDVDELHSRMLLLLLKQGPTKPGDAAKDLHISRPEAYRLLGDLAARGFAEATLTRPTLYAARPLDELFHDLFRAQEQRIQTLARLEQVLTKAAASYHPSPRASRSHTFRVITGRASIYEAILLRLAKIPGSCDLVQTEQAALALLQAGGVLDALRARANSGQGGARLLVPSQHAADAGAARLQAQGIEIRHVAPRAPVAFVILGGRELVLWVESDPSERLSAAGDVALLTNAPQHVATQAWLFESVWQQGEPVGPPPSVLFPALEPREGASAGQRPESRQGRGRDVHADRAPARGPPPG